MKNRKIKSSLWYNIIIGVIIFLYSFFLRTYRIESTFHWLGDQYRDWMIAQSSFSDLPLHGTPRVDGSYSYGPIFYWYLWFVNQIVGPFFDHLPYVGAYGLSFIKALSDVFLGGALVAVGFNPMLVWASILFLTSSPVDASISGTIWNPTFAAALIHCGVSFAILFYNYQKPILAVIAWLMALLAFQSHTSVIFPLLSIALTLAWVLYAKKFPFKKIKSILLTSLGVTLITFIPFLIFRFSAEGQAFISNAPESAFGSGFRRILNGSAFHTVEIYFKYTGMFLLGNLEPSMGGEIYGKIFRMLLLLVIWFLRKDLFWLFLVVGSIVLASLGYAIKGGGPPESYWYLTLLWTIPILLCVLLSKLSSFQYFYVFAIFLFIFSLTSQVHRFRYRDEQRLGTPVFGVMVKNARELFSTYPQIGNIIEHPMHPPTCAKCLYQLIGGKIEPQNPTVAIFDEHGAYTIK